MAVQIQHQQKQQLQTHDNSGLQDVVELQTLEPVNIYVDPIAESNLDVYRSMPDYKNEEEINFKYEDEPESSEEAISPPGSKKSLPHKKRIPRKLKQPGKKGTTKKQTNIANKETSPKSTSDNQIPTFKCELCVNKFTSQLKFFEHLKVIFVIIFLTIYFSNIQYRPKV